MTRPAAAASAITFGQFAALPEPAPRPSAKNDVRDDVRMAYDEDLANRIRELIAGEPDVTEKRMFGGLAFLVRGNMSVAASGQGGLMARVDPEETEALNRQAARAAVRDARPRDAGLAAGRSRGRAHEAPARALGQARRRVRAIAAG
jgi:TfoX/Sxy family transcriptional regulator of competence genes